VRDGDTRPGADVMYRPCSAFFTGSDQNWRVLQQPHGERALVNTRSGLVAGVRAGSTATGARLELQRDTGAAYPG
jgi:hypothetical protein